MLSLGGSVRRGVAPGASLVRHAAVRACGLQPFSASAGVPSAQVQQDQDNVKPYPSEFLPLFWGAVTPMFAGAFDVPMEVMAWWPAIAGAGVLVTTFRIAYNEGATWQRLRELRASIRRQDETGLLLLILILITKVIIRPALIPKAIIWLLNVE
ncbi:hypothetical protein WJX72_008537 [[Myrmecia] bisecta]|uniref:Uncharacterized protein n=1 Tax=[Myrmecia] bisecta TaxID=41462 RepID=A0AAW1PH02_9CHLO